MLKIGANTNADSNAENNTIVLAVLLNTLISRLLYFGDICDYGKERENMSANIICRASSRLI